MKCSEPTHGSSGKRPIPSENMSYDSEEIVDGGNTVGLDNTGFELDICSKELRSRSHENMNSSLNFSQSHKGSDPSPNEKRPLPEIPKTNKDQGASQQTGQTASNSFYDKIDEKNKSDCCDPVQSEVKTVYGSVDKLSSEGNENLAFSSQENMGKALLASVEEVGLLDIKNKDNQRVQSNEGLARSDSVISPQMQAAQQIEDIALSKELNSGRIALESDNEKHGLQVIGQLSPSQETRTGAYSPNEKRPLPEIPNSDTEKGNLSTPRLKRETSFNSVDDNSRGKEGNTTLGVPLYDTIDAVPAKRHQSSFTKDKRPLPEIPKNEVALADHSRSQESGEVTLNSNYDEIDEKKNAIRGTVLYDTIDELPVTRNIDRSLSSQDRIDKPLYETVEEVLVYPVAK